MRLEPRYLADGWLGALAGNKLYFDFSSEEKFKPSMEKVLKELGSRGKVGAGELYLLLFINHNHNQNTQTVYDTLEVDAC